MQLPEISHTAQTFIDLMNVIWDTPCEPTPDGGVICYVSPLYDKWHDARVAAAAAGLIRSGGGHMTGEHGKENCDIFRFPDDNSAGVRISHDGGRVELSDRRRRKIKN